uniref:Uncharacterized protein n=1 Tax=Ciona savignyi TaxID=51511 RepID=H2ZIA9_CIOSA
MDALADMVKIPGNITKTEMKVYPVVAQAKSCITVSSNASGKVNATREHVKQQILQTAELNNTVETVSNMATRLLHGLQNGTAQDAADIYSKVDIKMNEMRARNINQYKEMADTELEFAKDMLELVYTNFTARANQTEPQAHLFNEELIKQVGEIETKFRHLQMELSNASTDIRVATTKNVLNSQTLRQTMGNIERINNMATMTNVTLDEAQKIVNAAIDLYKSGLQNMEELKAYASST